MARLTEQRFAFVLGAIWTSLAIASPMSSASASRRQVPVSSQPPSISGMPKPGQTLTTSSGAWVEEPTEFKYRWERCTLPTESCGWSGDFDDEPSYVVSPKDVDSTIRVQVTAGNEVGWSDPVFSAPIAIESAWQYGIGPPEIEIDRWLPWRASQGADSVNGKTLTILVQSGLCLGEPNPVIDHIDVVERPKTAKRTFRSALITAFVRFPASVKVIGAVDDNGPVPACAGIGIDLFHRIMLKRPVDRLFVFDGAYTPPRCVLKPLRDEPTNASKGA